ncbi:MAG TPA: carboxypeptidase regulatory-like domain-containing protein [Bryobacteraceae bacterium]|nr:carboxypeptidase regulatory-like domain-containing protein [Bryobacteraceae bacterium]
MFLRTFLVCLLVLTAFGQGERGTFNGTISDSSGAAVVGATVKILNPSTGVETTAITTDAGVYRMPSLQPSTYQITVSAPGFKTSVRQNVVLAVAQTLTVDFTLELGNLTESITVSSEAPLLETGTAEIGSYVSKKEFDSWPIAVSGGRRQIQQFIFTSLPGTTGGTWQGSINGGQNYSHEILIDGISVGRMDLAGGANSEFSPSAESISEFKLQTGTVSAQYSGGQTSVANFATKSGTNQLHGSAYYYGQNDALRANSFNSNASGVARQPFKQHNYGYSIGGPVYIPKVYDGRNRSFFFHNMERTTQKDYNQNGFVTLPTQDFKRGDFSDLLSSAFTGTAGSGGAAGTDALGRAVQFGAIYDPASSRQVGNTWVRDVFPGNVIPQSRFSKVSANILSMAPIDDPLFDTMLRNIPALGACCPEFRERMITFKGDHNINTSHRLSGMVNRNLRTRYNSGTPRWGTAPGTPTNVYQNQDTPGTMVRLAYDFVLSPTFLGRGNLGYNRFGNINESVYVDQDWPQKIGLQNVPGVHFPVLNFTGQPFQGGAIGAVSGTTGRLGSGNRGGSFNGSTIGQLDFTYVRSKHNFKFGFENRRYYYNTRNKSGSGDFNFSPNQTALPGFINQTGHSFASFLLGDYSSTTRGIAAANFGHRWRTAGFYFQDDWKVNRKLTLNIGLRWEMVGGLIEVAGRMSAIDFDLANPGAGNRPGALAFADDLGVRGFQDTYWKQISPKFGFAYALSDKMVLRGGYGINNTPAISNGFGFGGTLGYNGNINVTSANTPIRFAEDSLGNLDQPYPSFTGTLPNKSPSLANGQNIDYYPITGNRLPYVQNWNFGIQYQLPWSMVLETNYVANKGTRLIAKGFDQPNNLPFTVTQQYGDLLPRPWSASSPIPAPYPGFSGTNLQALRPYPQFTGINNIFPNIGTSSYQSLQMQLTRHFKNGIAILGAYTWSKSLGLTDNAIDAENVADVFNRNLERSITNYHQPHVAKLSWIYELPIGPGRAIDVNGFLDKVVGGWQITAIHTFRSGNPVAITTGGLNLPTGNAIRPDYVGGTDIVANSDADINFRGIPGGTAYLNRAAFANPPVFAGGQNVVQRLGNVAPFLPNIRDRHLIMEDMSIQKMFKFDEQRNIELRGTFLNPFNRHGIGGLVTNITDPNFGQYTGQQSGPRNIELALRFTF